MNDKDFISQLANMPPPQPGFDALGMSAPVLVQMNPEGRWESSAPESLDQERLKAVVGHLVKTNAVRAAQSYCCQCAAGTAKDGGGAASNYVPVIMLPIYSADECPFDMDSQIDKMKKSDTTKPKKAQNKVGKQMEATQKKVPKKRGFVMQRLTDFDLLSQW